VVKIAGGYHSYIAQRANNPPIEKNAPVFHFSKHGKNVLFIMLDRAIPGYVPEIMKEKPELAESFREFTLYKNCVSFGGYTLLGVPALFGGYDYTPAEMQKHKTRKLVDKYDEAITVLPRLFAERGYKVTVTDPTRAGFMQEPDLRIFAPYAARTDNLMGRYTSAWLRKHPDVPLIDVAALLKNNLFHFSVFKIAPVIMRRILYDRGKWFSTSNFDASGIPQTTLDSYAVLDMLPAITVVDNSTQNTYTSMVNDLTHENTFLQAPDYKPVMSVTNKGTGPYADESHYHVNMAAYLLLAKWFAELKAAGVWDNTRIIIGSDHGWYLQPTKLFDFTLPNGHPLLNYNSLLMYKDFAGESERQQAFTVDNRFMTQADAPWMTVEGLFPANSPFTGEPLARDKSAGVTITTRAGWETPDPARYTWDISPTDWLHVKDNIFNPTNWTQAAPPTP
jgi:hypothetical protein